MRMIPTRHGLTSSPNPASPVDVDRVCRIMAYAEEFEDRWYWETDAEGYFTYLSRSVAQELEMFGLQTIGGKISELFKIDHSAADVNRSLGFHIISRTAFSNYSVRGARGLHENWWSISGRPWFDADGNFCGFVGSGTDLTRIRKQEATIRKLAVTDSLTGLANRQCMHEHLLSFLRSRADAKQADFALMMLDLDGFKNVNDTLGHPVGDTLLVQVAHRLSTVVGDMGIVGRLGGDEFQILLPGLETEAGMVSLAQQIIAEISSPYSIEGSAITVGCSIGIAIASEGTNAESLVQNADIALYAAKEGGRATFRFFKDAMLARAKRRKKLEDELRTAINANQLSLVFQPIVSVETEELTGFEALLRWHHPTEGLIGPGEFIPVAEESGLIQQVGDWVLRSAIEGLAQLPADLRVAVNVSPVQFSNPALLSTLVNALGEHQVAPSRLELEITESVFLDDEEKSQKIFRALKDIGVRLALDDFGTGYSSLAYLQTTPFDKIKIDQGFVRGAVDPRSRNAAIIESIVSLSKALGMETTAEGLEHQDEIALIRKLGCSHIQGFVYSPGLILEEILPDLETGVRKMRAIGYKRSRSPRINLLRSRRIVINDHFRNGRIRNLSATGALIDQIHFGENMVGVTISVEISDDTFFDGVVKWVEHDAAGVEFFERIDLQQVSR